MAASVLVAYATRYGSTQEVAAAVAAAMRQSGLAVELQPMRKVRALERHSAVVLGAPLYITHWHKDVHHFLAKHRKPLSQQRVAVFALGPIQDEQAQWLAVRGQLDQELARYPWLSPLAVEVFGGKYDPAALRFPDTLVANSPASPLYRVPAGDLRDWDAIRLWADGLAARFNP